MNPDILKSKVPVILGTDALGDPIVRRFRSEIQVHVYPGRQVCISTVADCGAADIGLYLTAAEARDLALKLASAAVDCERR